LRSEEVEVTMADKVKKAARALQVRTGWKYRECFRCVTTMTPEAIEALIQIRGATEKIETASERLDRRPKFYDPIAHAMELGNKTGWDAMTLELVCDALQVAYEAGLHEGSDPNNTDFG
jgi:hypothetical protein